MKVKPILEQLESRNVPNVTFQMASGVLHITGDADHNGDFVVRDSFFVPGRVTVTHTPPGQQGQVLSYDTQSIVFRGLGPVDVAVPFCTTA
jgi:hypothetical protein